MQSAQMLYREENDKVFSTESKMFKFFFRNKKKWLCFLGGKNLSMFLKSFSSENDKVL